MFVLIFIAYGCNRGGIATVINEIAQDSKICIELDESLIPIRETVKGVCELIGYDPLYLANEGTIVAAIPEEFTEIVLKEMKKDPAGVDSCVIGKVTTNILEMFLFVAHLALNESSILCMVINYPEYVKNI